jgi:hypothetical protein
MAKGADTKMERGKDSPWQFVLGLSKAEPGSDPKIVAANEEADRIGADWAFAERIEILAGAVGLSESISSAKIHALIKERLASAVNHAAGPA